MLHKIIRIVPDLHGNTEAFNKAIENIDDVNQIIFLGDYTDPYDTDFDDINLLKQVIEFKKNNMEKCELLVGNHEYNYIEISRGYCSRYDSTKFKEINKLLLDNEHLFKFNVIIPHPTLVNNDIIVGHSAISNEWFANNLSFDFQERNIFTNEEWIKQALSISRFRGGRDMYASPLWLDYREFNNGYCTPLQNVIQIIGHTKIKCTLAETIELPYNDSLEVNEIANRVYCIDNENNDYVNLYLYDCPECIGILTDPDMKNEIELE